MKTQSDKEIVVLFHDTERSYWLETITEIHDRFSDSVGVLSIERVIFDFAEHISPKDIRPFHLVTLACLIHFLKGIDLDVYISQKNKDIFRYTSERGKDF